MAFATDIFNGDGSETEFELTFKYIQRDHVKVYRVAEDETETELTVVTDGTDLGDDDYKWETDKKVKLGKAPSDKEKCKVVRETPEDEQLVQWKDGSYITAEDLNTSDKQWLFVDQEHHDRIETLEGYVPTLDAAAITEEQAEKDPTDPAWSGDDRLATAGAIDRIYSNIVGDADGFPGTDNKGKRGKFRIDNSIDPQKMFWWDESLATPAWVEIEIKGADGPKGDKGDTGDTGPAPGLQDPATAVSNVANKSDGSVGDATVSIEQDSTSKDLKFTFGIPVGEKGDKGGDGTDGAAATVEVDSTVTLDAGNDAKVTNTGTTSAAKFKFEIPKGPKGDKGADGTGAGTVTEVKAGNGISVTDATTTPTVTAKSGDNSITVDSDGIKVKIKSGGGITLDTDGLSASGGGGSGKASIGEDPPEAASDANKGEFWFNDDQGRLYMSYPDATDSGDDKHHQWIAVAPPSATPAIPTLDQVCDQGNTTDKGAEFGGDVERSSGTANTWSRLTGSGVSVGRQNADAASAVFQGFGGGSATADRTSLITSNGAATFDGIVSASDNNIRLTENNGGGELIVRQDTTTGNTNVISVVAGGASPATNGVINLRSDGNIVLRTAGAGIQFGSTNSGGDITSQTLDDYEEGTWTPTSDAGNPSITNLGSFTGTYIKVGGQVTVLMSLFQSSNNMGFNAGNYRFNGLPFAPNTTFIGSGLMFNSANAMESIPTQALGGSQIFAEIPALTSQRGLRFTITYFTDS